MDDYAEIIMIIILIGMFVLLGIFSPETRYAMRFSAEIIKIFLLWFGYMTQEISIALISNMFDFIRMFRF